MKQSFYSRFLLYVIAILIPSFAQALPPDGHWPPGLQRAVEVQERHMSALMARQGVEGIAVSLNENGESVIVLYTARAGIPDLPIELEGIPVTETVSGRFVARVDPTAKYRPVPMGVSSGHPSITAGTLGCWVRDANGQVFALSNNHVFAASNDASLGDNILQPGPYDGGQNPADAFATLYDVVDISFNGTDNLMDAALALPAPSVQLIFATPGAAGSDGYGNIIDTQVKSASVGLSVQKYGRTTGWTQGTVTGLNAALDVCYETAGPFRCKKSARFVQQITIGDGGFSSGGDSGSCIVTNTDGNNQPVALLFAGSDTQTIASPMQAVLNAFGVTIDNGSGVVPTNYPPMAAFTYTISDLTVTFTDASTDDVGVVSWQWDFENDGQIDSQVSNPVHSYPAYGTYSVTLKVTDGEGLTHSTTESVTVSSSSTADITLTANGYKEKGLMKVDLSWSGIDGSNVDLYRDGALLASPENSGAYTDPINKRGGGSFTYSVCETGAEQGSTNCSADVTVTF